METESSERSISTWAAQESGRFKDEALRQFGFESGDQTGDDQRFKEPTESFNVSLTTFRLEQQVKEDKARRLEAVLNALRDYREKSHQESKAKLTQEFVTVKDSLTRQGVETGVDHTRATVVVGALTESDVIYAQNISSMSRKLPERAIERIKRGVRKLLGIFELITGEDRNRDEVVETAAWANAGG